MKNSDALATFMTVLEMENEVSRLQLDFSLPLPLAERISNAFVLSKSCHSWDNSDEGRFTNALAFLKKNGHVTTREFLLIANEISLLRCLAAAVSGVPVDWIAVEQCGYRAEVGLRDLWDKAHERERCAKANDVMDRIGATR